MKKIFNEWGGTIIIVIAIVALIGLVSLLMQPGGVLYSAFGSITQAFVDKSDEMVDGAGSSAGGSGDEAAGCDTLYWDGNTEGLELVDLGGALFVKISDAVPQLSDCTNGCSFNYLDNDDSNSMSAEYDTISNLYQQYGFLNLTFAVVVPTDNFEMAGFVFPEAGTYFMYEDSSTRAVSWTIPGYTGFPHSENCGH